MDIEFDQDKRDKTLQERGLDFARVGEILTGPIMTEKGTRINYGENRFMTLGYLDGRMVVLVRTPAATTAEIFR